MWAMTWESSDEARGVRAIIWKSRTYARRVRAMTWESSGEARDMRAIIWKSRT